MENMVNPWIDRRVFITGHTGFKGGWLALWLASRGAKIRGYALDPPTEPSLFGAASVSAVLDEVRGDIRDSAKLAAAISEFRPEMIFHLAAQPLVRHSYADPLGTYATNVMGTVHLLESARQCDSVRVVVCSTTDKVYENHGWVWPYRESDRLGGFDPYSSSKVCSELVVDSYRSSFFSPDRHDAHKVALTTVRAGNVIGGGDWAKDRLIPDLIRGFQGGKTVQIRNPKAVRPWQHVLDALNGYILLAERMWSSPEGLETAFNFGPSVRDACSVEHIANKLAQMWGSGASWTCDEVVHPHEHQSLRLDASRARERLNWTPRLELESALEWTFGWYLDWLHGADMRNFTNAQISNFLQLI